MKFLVVDASVTMRRIIVNSLQRIGYTNCVEGVDGQEALEKFDDSFGFVITVWNMPNMSGLEFVQALRAHPDGKEIPILMVTTKSDKEDTVAHIGTGFNEYVVKPFTPHVLKDKIDAILASLIHVA